MKAQVLGLQLSTWKAWSELFLQAAGEGTSGGEIDVDLAFSLLSLSVTLPSK